MFLDVVQNVFRWQHTFQIVAFWHLCYDSPMEKVAKRVKRYQCSAKFVSCSANVQTIFISRQGRRTFCTGKQNFIYGRRFAYSFWKSYKQLFLRPWYTVVKRVYYFPVSKASCCLGYSLLIYLMTKKQHIYDSANRSLKIREFPRPFVVK